MTDRKICRKCIHYTRYDGVCNYILDTGEKRLHDGDICYSYESTSGRGKKSPEQMPTGIPEVRRKAEAEASQDKQPCMMHGECIFSTWHERVLPAADKRQKEF